MNKTTLNSQKEKHSMLSLRRATRRGLSLPCRRRYFYPRSPCGERRCLRWCASISSRQFLSTLSLRRATPPTRPPTPQQYNFYPRSPCGERPADRCGASCRFLFLSTLSLRRATCNMHSLRYCCTNFYPRSPCGERPINALLFLLALNISIHALLAESDGTGADRGWPVPHFYPRSPCGERHVFIVGVAAGVRFLSTLSLRRATVRLPAARACLWHFYPRSPCGERLCGIWCP